jgi:hypothetical protein
MWSKLNFVLLENISLETPCHFSRFKPGLLDHCSKHCIGELYLIYDIKLHLGRIIRGTAV